MENKSSERIRATEPEGRQLRSHRVVENRQLETIKRGEKGGVGIIVRKRTARKDRPEIFQKQESSDKHHSRLEIQDRQNPQFKMGEGGSLGI